MSKLNSLSLCLSLCLSLTRTHTHTRTHMHEPKVMSAACNGGSDVGVGVVVVVDGCHSTFSITATAVLMTPPPPHSLHVTPRRAERSVLPGRASLLLRPSFLSRSQRLHLARSGTSVCGGGVGEERNGIPTAEGRAIWCDLSV